MRFSLHLKNKTTTQKTYTLIDKILNNSKHTTKAARYIA